MAALVDTNILVYRHERRFPAKQRKAEALIRHGVANGDLRLPHQALLEFVAATTRGKAPLLRREEAWREAEELLAQFPVLYPTQALVRLALRGAATYNLSWFDAHLWAYAEHYGMETLLSEDFQHGRRYGLVTAHNPFVEAS